MCTGLSGPGTPGTAALRLSSACLAIRVDTWVMEFATCTPSLDGSVLAWT
jgi:hypothetical protein